VFTANWFNVELNIHGFVANANSWLIKVLLPLSVDSQQVQAKSDLCLCESTRLSPTPEHWQCEDFSDLKTEWHWLFLSACFVLIFFTFPPPLCYRCHCPPQLEGPNCQQTRLSFLGNGYAWFPPIKPCFDSHLSLEFMTEEDDGLLLYAGPLATLLPGDSEDYMAIGKDSG